MDHHFNRSHLCVILSLLLLCDDIMVAAYNRPVHTFQHYRLPRLSKIHYLQSGEALSAAAASAPTTAVTSIYVIELEGGRYYVGRSKNIENQVSAASDRRRICLDKKIQTN